MRVKYFNKTGNFVFILLFLSVSIHLYAQSGNSEKADSLNSPARSVIFIPADWQDVTANSMETRTADLFMETAFKLDDIEVVDWLYADDVFFEESMEVKDRIDPSLALFVGEYGKIDHVYLFRIKSFIQEGRPYTKDDRSFLQKLGNLFINLFENDESETPGPHAKNIHTEIVVEFELIDTRLAEIIQMFSIHAEHTGGRRLISETEMMEMLSDRFLAALKRIYYTSAKIAEINGKIILNEIENNYSVSRGDKFEILLPDSFAYINNSEVFVPGEAAGYCMIDRIFSDYYTAGLLRQWAPIDTGFLAVEARKQKYGFSLDYLPPVKNRYMALNATLYYSPLHAVDWGGAFRIQKTEDSDKHHNWGIGFGLFGSYRLVNISRFALKPRLDANLDIFFRDDDADESVSLALGSIAPGIAAEFLYSRNTDIIIHAGYRFSGDSDNWEVNTDDENPDINAYWDASAPEMDLTGVFLVIGFRFLFY